jgi:hypothetical protein
VSGDTRFDRVATILEKTILWFYCSI